MMTTRFLPGAGGSTQTTEHVDLGHFRQALLEQRRFRLTQLRELAGIDPQTSHQSEQLSEVSAALRIAAENALAEVGAALARLDAGTYGRCVRCGQQVLPERLEIVPMAALCMSCQRHQERAEPDAEDGH